MVDTELVPPSFFSKIQDKKLKLPANKSKKENASYLFSKRKHSNPGVLRSFSTSSSTNSTAASRGKWRERESVVVVTDRQQREERIRAPTIPTPPLFPPSLSASPFILSLTFLRSVPAYSSPIRLRFSSFTTPPFPPPIAQLKLTQR
jgi:hypothetical protein